MPFIVTNAALLRSLQALHAKVDILMSTQDEVNALATDIAADVARENTALDAIKAALAAAVAANPGVDLSALQAAVASQDAAVAAEEAVAAPPAP